MKNYKELLREEQELTENKAAFKRMEGLVDRKDLRDIKFAGKAIASELEDEGFEKTEILAFIASKIF